MDKAGDQWTIVYFDSPQADNSYSLSAILPTITATQLLHLKVVKYEMNLDVRSMFGIPQ